MNFASLTYAVFFAAVLVALARTKSSASRRTVLLVASYLFYAWWDWRLAFLLAGITLLNHGGALWVASVADPKPRKLRLAAIVALDVAVLGVFKYLGFFVESADRLLQTFGSRFSLLEVALPVGLSFITFQVISYVVDVHRGTIEPAPLRDVALLVAFFPHVVAGPILKPGHFLAQLQGEARLSSAQINAGFQQFILGLAAKILVADQLAPYVDSVFSQPSSFSAGTLRLAVLAYSVQIYADFSGYSNMAIGSARCLGIHIPRNFNAPYVARNITQFWRRWHISLSNWISEYIYQPLGGSRKGAGRRSLNLLITMLLAGLWHGPTWNFIFWGGLHGCALVVHRWWSDRRASILMEANGVLSYASSWVVTFGFVSLAWVYFRAPDFAGATTIVSRVVGIGEPSGVAWYGLSALVLVPVVLGIEALVAWRGVRLPELRLVSFRGAFVVTTLVIAFAILWPTQPTPFIYWRF